MQEQDDKQQNDINEILNICCGLMQEQDDKQHKKKIINTLIVVV